MFSLKEYPNFTRYKDVLNRGMDIAKILIDICLQNPNVDMSQIQGNSKSNPLIDLPKMDKLIEYGMVSTGDEIYVNTDRDNSKAILIHENMLILKGEN